VTEILALHQVKKAFGAVVIADGLDLSVKDGEAVGIIGPNGAGKSTLFNLITGDLALDGGSIEFLGNRVEGVAPHKRCRLGMGRSYQIPHPFSKMTVYENVLTSAVYGRSSSEKDAEAPAVEVLQLTGLLPYANHVSGKLTLLQRKRLELARALATGPKLLLLDEIAGGLTEQEVKMLIGTIMNIRSTGICLIWIEHIMHALIATVDRIAVLNGGRFIADGKPLEVMKTEAVQRSYLGTAEL
jgi:branched-chain amino acid transport system ATP-binding protein